MAKNILKAGYSLCVSAASKGAEELKGLGARVVQDYIALAQNSDVVITMLPDSPEVKAVVLGEGGLLEGMRSGSLLIDMSSISPVASKEIAAALAAKGVLMLDAPVSGGEPKAIDGTLSIMVGGKREVFDSNCELLLTMGASAVYCGENGAGNTTKLANQIITAVNMAALSEALVLGKALGVEPSDIYGAIRGGLAGSVIMDAKAPMMIERNFRPGFKCELHLKDLRNVLSAGETVPAELPLATAVFAMFEEIVAKGIGPEDHSALIKYYESKAGLQIAE